MSDATIEVSGRTIEISHPDKVLFPDDGITKRDLAEYYARIAGVAQPHYQDRPLTMQRFPEGIGESGFFQKNIPDYFPDWIERVELPKEGGTVTHVLANDAATLVYLANQGCITPHLALSRAQTPERPDRMIFDLDPSDGDFGKVQEVAKAVKAALDDRDLPSFVAATGSRGLHIVLVLDASVEVDRLRPFARDLSAEIAEAHPALATTEQRKEKRGDRVLVDTFRTAYGQTAVGAYAVRARPGAPVATPLKWDEALASDMAPDRYDIRSVFRRLGQISDPWADIDADPIAADRLVGDG
ncbi:ATP-dependent DNA ligase [Rhodobacterales bacterium HKCCE3408]|nr:ATP-dependent DNA ligase [Rhodobacterales bacterium HKCCE3408]